nr:activator of basal transcription 1-like [Leptinotarsa decemlineata]
MTQENSASEPSTSPVKLKTPKKGIIYLSSIPPYMNVSLIKEVFSKFGTVGRIYLQLADKDMKDTKKEKSKRKKVSKFTEGWVEFERKSVAKKVVALLNNTQVSNRKKSKQYDHIWSMKYLSRFKWTHLHERLAYEKAARRQKLRAEIQLAKKKSTFFAQNLKKKATNSKAFEHANTVEEEKKETDIVDDRKQFLQDLFL